MMNKEQAEAALRAALEKISSGFVDSLKTDSMKNALGAAQDVDGMSDEDFSNLLAGRMSILDEEERREAERSISRQIERWVGRKIACWHGGENEPLSLREEILLDLQTMIKRHDYYADRS